MPKKAVKRKRTSRKRPVRRYGRGFIGDLWKGVKSIFKESPEGGPSTFSKYAKMAGDITGHQGLKDVAETVGRYGKKAVDIGEDLGYGRRRRRRAARGGMVNLAASAFTPLSMGYGKRRKRGGLASKLIM